MTALARKSAQEISDLLEEYGIKHGPVVDSTRSLYEKKLREAMAEATPVKSSPDKTYYREEQEEITYVHRRVPLKSEAFVAGGRSYTSTENYREEEEEDDDDDDDDERGDQPSLYRTETSHRYVTKSKSPLKSLSAATQKETSTHQTGRLIPLWLQFLVFLVVVMFLYYVFTSMETPVKNPFKGVE